MRERVCGNPLGRDSRHCPIHEQEMVTFMASNESGDLAEERESKFTVAAVVPDNRWLCAFEMWLRLRSIWCRDRCGSAVFCLDFTVKISCAAEARRQAESKQELLASF